MPEFINYNGKIITADEPVLTVDNRSFSYGDGIFETIRLSNGNILFFEDHFNRLTRGAHFLKLKLPEYFTRDFLQQQILLTAECNEISLNGRVRITIFRSGKGKYEPESNLGHWVINISPLYRPDYQWSEKGLHLGVFNSALKPCDESSNFKTTSALIYVLAGMYKKEKGFDETIILNTRGHVADTIYANVFIVKNKKITTPSLKEGPVDGVMRRQILKLAKNVGYKVSEGIVTIEDVELSDEVFLTNSIKGIMWINRFNNKAYDNTIGFSLIEALNDLIS
jgi:branched-chain amino acid aminotransferase